MDLEDLADPPALDQLARLLDMRHAPLLHADLDDLLVPILGLDDRRALGRVVRQRLLDVDVLAGVAGVDRHRHVPVVGAADQDGVDVLAVEELAIVLGRDRLGIGELLGVVEVGVVDVADGRDPDAGNLGQRLHQVLAAPARAQAGDRERVVGRVAPRRFERRQCADRAPATPIFSKNARRVVEERAMMVLLVRMKIDPCAVYPPRRP